MKTQSSLRFLKNSLKELTAARTHLEYSHHKVLESMDQISSDSGLSEVDLEHIEAFTSRFARVVDLISRRVLRALDQYEFLEPGTLIDIANRAEKREIIPSAGWLRELTDARNLISHDYAGQRIIEFLSN